MTTDEFDAIVRDWLATAQHPQFKRAVHRVVYQPMLELLAYLRANGFKTFIVSGGGVEFMRPWAEQAYGIPPEQVIGSQHQVKFELQRRQARALRLPKIDFDRRRPGKPVGIQRCIGRRPILAFGNSDGDLQMLRVHDGRRRAARLMLLVHHTDAEREYAYDRESHIGKLDKAWTRPPGAAGSSST